MFIFVSDKISINLPKKLVDIYIEDIRFHKTSEEILSWARKINPKNYNVDVFFSTQSKRKPSTAGIYIYSLNEEIEQASFDWIIEHS